MCLLDGVILIDDTMSSLIENLETLLQIYIKFPLLSGAKLDMVSVRKCPSK